MGSVGSVTVEEATGLATGAIGAAKGLTPRLPISVEPSGIPARGAPPGVVGVVDVGAEEAARLPAPEPHMPDIPEVSKTPDGVAIPELCCMAEAVCCPVGIVVLPVDAPGAIPPPSKADADAVGSVS